MNYGHGLSNQIEFMSERAQQTKVSIRLVNMVNRRQNHLLVQDGYAIPAFVIASLLWSRL